MAEVNPDIDEQLEAFVEHMKAKFKKQMGELLTDEHLEIYAEMAYRKRKQDWVAKYLENAPLQLHKKIWYKG